EDLRRPSRTEPFLAASGRQHNWRKVLDDLSMFLPRFKWGNVVPTQQGDRVRRGPGYQFYKLVPNDIMEFATGKGVEEPLEAGDLELARANYWAAAEQLAGEKVDAIIIGGMPVSA